MPDLDHLKKLLGNETLVARFIELFGRQMPVQMTTLRQYIDQKQWENAAAEAHTIKGQLGYLNEEEAMALAYDIERLAEREEGDAARQMTERLAEKVEQIVAALKAAVL
ncbi:MAG: Hpt domain-containing protein [Saprospiraceae bacterium]|nr:Hpt domain-containing protein [Saprospiraceae bacterium]